MRISEPVKRILDGYESDNPGTKGNLARILMQGRLGGSGKVVILPVDQGFEHGPARSFAPNPPAYDPHYHYQLAIEADGRRPQERAAEGDEVEIGPVQHQLDSHQDAQGVPLGRHANCPGDEQHRPGNQVMRSGDGFGEGVHGWL